MTQNQKRTIQGKLPAGQGESQSHKLSPQATRCCEEAGLAADGNTTDLCHRGIRGLQRFREKTSKLKGDYFSNHFFLKPTDSFSITSTFHDFLQMLHISDITYLSTILTTSWIRKEANRKRAWFEFKVLKYKEKQTQGVVWICLSFLSIVVWLPCLGPNLPPSPPKVC